jgi:hypothetical protein
MKPALDLSLYRVLDPDLRRGEHAIAALPHTILLKGAK